MKFPFHFKLNFMSHCVLINLQESKCPFQKSGESPDPLPRFLVQVMTTFQRTHLSDLVHTNHLTIQHLRLNSDIYDGQSHHHLPNWTAFLTNEDKIVVTVIIFSIFQDLLGFTIIHMELCSNGNSFHGDTS